MEGLEPIGEDDCAEDGCGEEALRHNFKPFTEELSICDQKSAEKRTLNEALESTHRALIKELQGRRERLTRQDLLDLLAKQRDMLLSVKECLEAQAGAGVAHSGGCPARKKIAKRHRTGRKRAVARPESAQFGLGPVCVLPSPVEVEPEMYVEDDNFSLPDYDLLQPTGGHLNPERHFFSTGRTDDEVYGVRRFDGGAYDRNLYFGLSDSLNDL